jgi:ribosome-associated toxin RatA of RatAB toxin-antitoxin module
MQSMELKRSVLVPYAVHDMFDLIEQAELYPSFVPWCTAAHIIERSDEWVAARLDFSFQKIRFGFHTRNPKRRPTWLQLRLVEGPFRHFQGEWTLTPVGTEGCRVAFSLSFEVAAGVLDRIAAPAVSAVTGAMVDAFVRRADAVLGTRAPAPLGDGAGPG